MSAPLNPSELSWHRAPQPTRRGRPTYEVRLTPCRVGWSYRVDPPGLFEWAEDGFGWRPTRAGAKRRAARIIAKDRAEKAHSAAAITYEVKP